MQNRAACPCVSPQALVTETDGHAGDTPTLLPKPLHAASSHPLQWGVAPSFLTAGKAGWWPRALEIAAAGLAGAGTHTIICSWGQRAAGRPQRETVPFITRESVTPCELQRDTDKLSRAWSSRAFASLGTKWWEVSTLRRCHDRFFG